MSKIKKLYNNISKHSHYQTLPKSVETLVGEVSQSIERYEYERFDYIKSNLNLNKKKILDVGANTGFFAIMSLENKADSITIYEGNKDHCDFIKNISDVLKLNIDIKNDYLTLDTELNYNFDITFLLNVVHHLGDDFGKEHSNILLAKEKMIELINKLSYKTKYLVLQMGYCWKGDRNKLLFENGTKSEMISFIKSNTINDWEIKNIGIMDLDKKYYDSNNIILNRIDELKEFGNRPLFILKSKNFNNGNIG